MQTTNNTQKRSLGIIFNSKSYKSFSTNKSIYKLVLIYAVTSNSLARVICFRII